MSFTYEYARPALTVDCLVFYLNYFSKKLEIILIERKNDPFKNCLAIPGGFVDVGESVDTAAKRELEEETNLKLTDLIQFYAFGDPKRDPREHVVSFAHYGFTSDISSIKAQSDAKKIEVVSLNDVLAGKYKLAFDHLEIIKMAHTRMQEKIRFSSYVFSLLPEKFTMSQLQGLFEIVQGKLLHNSNFRNKFLSMNILKEVGTQTDVDHRPAKIYSFDKEKYDLAVKNGFNFQI